MLHLAPINRSAAHAVQTRGPLHRTLTSAALMFSIATLAACKPEEKSAIVVETAPAANPEAAADTAPTSSPTAASGAAALIGKTVPPYPDGLEEASGSCVAGGEGLEHACDFGVATIGNRAASGEVSVRYLLASRNIDTAAKQPQWEVTDAVDAPSIDSGYDLQIAGCRLNGADAPGLVAVVRHGDAEFSSDATWARRFDTATGKLSDIPVDSVDCANLSAGI
jgi:hypothetical protein